MAPFIAQYPEYRNVLADHLLTSKLRHWDKALRALAAKGLAALVPTEAATISNHAVDTLLPLCTDDVLEVRTGAVLGLAELMPAVAKAVKSELMVPLNDARRQGVAGVIVALEQGRFYRGKGGELMREVACTFVQLLSEAHLLYLEAAKPQVHNHSKTTLAEEHTTEQTVPLQKDKNRELNQQQSSKGGTGVSSLPLTAAYHSSAISLIQDCLSHALQSIRMCGVCALKSYALAHMLEPVQRQQIHQLMHQCKSKLHDGNLDARRGATAALGVFPAALVVEEAQAVIQALCEAAQVWKDVVHSHRLAVSAGSHDRC